ncbi:Mandelate racemase/muconate lactonizing protein [Segniliparus rotundus DSM 44985]|uniref:o-succinylbenzoate synthase n=1 Tax=Segniliparus rotundus (strain ATCC BAA-972 / CDC 1076 / CIP 108378 / DSM 44985 / JCM 13578) TaxID=640132 RepID=D6ZDH0_SEGRD|nr:o-succinylbenzoate synthase [Segniliparus rotundus]ADG97234.1 Mandelate racemase/muconate lactonizing protein [Segniliparus rotundus DSM 44985]
MFATPLGSVPVARADFLSVAFYSIPLNVRFRGVTVREGVLLEGPNGWGEFCAFDDYDDQESLPWLRTALEAALEGWPAQIRRVVPVNSIIPAVGPDEARRRALSARCATAKIKVADHPDSLAEDLARVEAVRDALGPGGHVRIDVNGKWDVGTARKHIPLLDKAAGGLQYVEQPCWTIDELAAVRKAVDVPIAADESIRRAEDPLKVAVAGAADVAVVKCTPLGGVRRALQVAEAAGLPTVVSSAVETSVGLGAQLALAAALPELPYACGFGTGALLTGDLVAPEAALGPKNGSVMAPMGPLAPDPELLARWTMPDPARVQWWSDRLDRVLALHNAQRGR